MTGIRRINRRSFLALVTGGAAMGGAALLGSGDAAALQTDSDSGHFRDPKGHGATTPQDEAGHDKMREEHAREDRERIDRERVDWDRDDRGHTDHESDRPGQEHERAPDPDPGPGPEAH